MNDMLQPRPSATGKGHHLSARDRGEITVSGVSDVVSFDEANVRLVTVCGVLNLEGEGLRIHVLNTEEGTVAVTGRLNGVLYEDEDRAEAPARGQKPRARRLFGG